MAEEEQQPSEQLSIIVKSPTDTSGLPPHAVQLPQSASVGDLKVQLSHSHPRRPCVINQRLIHAGKLLSDNAKLADTLTGPAPQTVHLVVRQPPGAAASPAAVPTPQPQPQAQVTPDIRQGVAEAEAAFARVLYHQQRYIQLVRGTGADGAVDPGAVAAELEVVRAAVAAYDASAARQRDAMRAAAGGAPAPALVQVPAQAPFPNPGAGAAAAAGWGANDHAQRHLNALDAYRAALAANAGAAGGVGVPAGAGAAPAAAAPAPGADGAPVIRRQFVFQMDLHWGLLLKLGLFVFVLAQEGSPRRTKILGAVAVFVYLWQTGHLGFVRRLLGVLLPAPATLFTNPEQARGAAMASYVYSFFYGLVCSLLPSWTPQPLPTINRQPAPAPVPAPAE